MSHDTHEHMNRATFMPDWLARYGFEQTGEQEYRGTLVPVAAREIIDRHMPPLPTRPNNIAKDYEIPVPAHLVISPSGRVIQGGTELAAIAGRDSPTAARIRIEGP